tara:strand:+ start:765 stop:986 length:222 start_codon:yes stop_codon:yes gene_type:complete
MTIRIEDLAAVADQLPAATLEQLTGFTPQPTRQRSFTVEQERQWAIKVLNVIANLPQDHRRRVLERALKMHNA